MPHLVLEYSHNVLQDADFPAIFTALHTALVELEGFPLADLKTRAVRHDVYHIGDGASRGAFVHLTFHLLAGRDISVRQRILQACQRVLNQHCAPWLQQFACQLTVEVREMDRSTYAKLKTE